MSRLESATILILKQGRRGDAASIMSCFWPWIFRAHATGHFRLKYVKVQVIAGQGIGIH